MTVLVSFASSIGRQLNCLEKRVIDYVHAALVGLAQENYDRKHSLGEKQTFDPRPLKVSFKIPWLDSWSDIQLDSWLDIKLDDYLVLDLLRQAKKR